MPGGLRRQTRAGRYGASRPLRGADRSGGERHRSTDVRSGLPVACGRTRAPASPSAADGRPARVPSAAGGRAARRTLPRHVGENRDRDLAPLAGAAYRWPGAAGALRVSPAAPSRPAPLASEEQRRGRTRSCPSRPVRGSCLSHWAAARPRPELAEPLVPVGRGLLRGVFDVPAAARAVFGVPPPPGAALTATAAYAGGLGRFASLSHANQPPASATTVPRQTKRAARPHRERPSSRMSGGVLLSHAVPRAVPSALKGLTSGFGMGPGVSPSL